MNFLIELIWDMAGDDTVLFWFLGMMTVCMGVILIGAVCNALGKTGRVAFLVALTVVAVVWMLTRS